MRRLLPRLSLLLALLAPLPALAAPAPEVVVSVKPLHSLVAGVMVGAGTPYLLVPGAASPHAFAMRPSDAKALRQARLVVWAGPALETFMEKPLTALAGNAKRLTLMDVPGMRTVPARAGGVWEAHDHDHSHDHDHDHGHDHDHSHSHDHDATLLDGHLWLDPRNAQAITRAVAAELARLDPERASLYQRNADAQLARIAALDAELEASLAPVRNQPFIVFHDAYHYLEDRYGLNAAGSITVSPDQRPGAARLAALRQVILDRNAACVFSEPQFEPALVSTLVAGTKARTGVLDPEGANLAEGPELYDALMRFNARSLVDCLSGG
ncbi:zinc ABC transporter substrate-binding protein [Niveispirillum irakense]|uniref:zinc ABC transporter substrate-binding protein n=1 Tax=Niveispirillum irakense TaxID=34011 RepID=UPI00041ADC36|nr:zinc ABC transporter substrate-binding protein [Niveispirillum irakense]